MGSVAPRWGAKMNNNNFYKALTPKGVEALSALSDAGY